MSAESSTNGIATPVSSKYSNLALTEYSTVPTPDSENDDGKQLGSPPNWGIPDAFLLPNGYPDVRYSTQFSRKRQFSSSLTHSPPYINLSNRLECRVLLKREDLLPVFSFKLRGAYNKMAHLNQEQSWKGVIACSAGETSPKPVIPATIVMPSGTPAIKHLNVARLGGSVILHGDDFDAAKAEAHRLEKQHGLTSIPPFDDPYVIAGQGTIGMEILRQANLQKLEAVFCAVGGGGLIAGIGVYLKRIAPHVKIIGVEAHDANAMAQSLDSGSRVLLKDVGLFADGAAVKAVGEEPYRLAREVIDEVIQVSTDETCAAIKDAFEDTRSIIEPAGALALAGLKKYVSLYPDPNPKRELVAITSGANMDFDRLRFVAERAALGERKEALLSVNIPEQPGSFAKLVEVILPHAVTAFSYRYARDESADVFMGISLSASTGQKDLAKIMEELDKGGMKAKDLSDDELAKRHVRFLVGGRCDVKDERLFMFEFPERPGALAKFLTTLRPSQNLSLFHYRNYGGDVGKVLAGIQCPPSEKDQLEAFLRDLGYPFSEHTDSSTYHTFLRS
ncbi:unnamed protein product [Aspergillus oryzae]|uniref:Threonine dehydratase n=2 Tax=Aspergillus oryzae TaxID=5062 RepID=A0AAN4Y7U3_ASPOZ|nr:unnamed protein product [Aspergillus oryzae]GMF84422.1 unnamed protein product [Aspergillus oryzae]GMG05409.1 unnamed protein product [Aspergillus oryzae]GMG23825.1 unnamed protein product [Aspergillus oryzae]GMG44319.1 unnamed protein product [Aspergillus oryzae var. brunneus]